MHKDDVRSDKDDEDEISDNYALQSQLLLPFLPTPKSLIRKVFDEIKNQLDFETEPLLYDLGSGDGRVLMIAASEYGYRCKGFEINKQIFMNSRDKIGGLPEHVRSRIELRRRDFFNLDLNDADVVFIYATARSFRFMKHLLATCRAGTILVLVRFQPDEDFLQSIGLRCIKEVDWDAEELSKKMKNPNALYRVAIYAMD